MDHLESVVEDGEKRSHWTATGPLGRTVEWDAEIINERPNELIAWRSIPGSDLDTAGSVHFESAGRNRGTIVTVSLKYDPPAGRVGAVAASLLGSGFEQSVDQCLSRFKQIMEAGEIPSIGGQPRGTCSA
jgi:uncharacterized membrane protein